MSDQGFPWPQSPTAAQVTAAVEASRKLQAVRTTALKTAKGGLRVLYDTLALPGKNPLRDAHDALDTAVVTAYGFDSKWDVVAQVFALKATVAVRIKTGQPVTGPGVPAVISDKSTMVSSDCAVKLE